MNTTKEYSVAAIASISIACVIWSMLTVGGNILVIVSFLVNRKLQIATNYYIISLAVADFIIGLFTINFFAMYIILNHWPLGEVTCNLWLLADYGGCQASVFSLVLVCHDRYKAVHEMDLSRRHRIGKAKATILITWIVSMIIWIPLIFVYPVATGYKMQEGECLAVFLRHSTTLTLMSHIIGYFVPVIIIIIQYTRLYKLLTIREREMHSSLKAKPRESKFNPLKAAVAYISSSGSKNQLENTSDCKTKTPSDNSVPLLNESGKQSAIPFNDTEKELEETSLGATATIKVATLSRNCKRLAVQRKVLKMIFLVVATYIVCWTLYEIFAMIRPFCETCIPASLWNFSYGFCYVNSTLNPFCYTGANKEFRDTFKRILLCRGMQERELYSNSKSTGTDENRDSATKDFSTSNAATESL